MSEAKPFYRSPAPRTPFDELDDEHERLFRQQDRLDEQRRWLQEQAREAGRKEMDRQLRGLTPYFRKRRINLRDIRLLFNPVDYIAFRGLSEKLCTSVELLDGEATSHHRERLQRSIENTIAAGDVSWMTMRIADDGKVVCSSSSAARHDLTV